MQTIDAFSRAAVDFTLRWSSEQADHIDQLRGDPVSLWRDVLDPGLVAALIGKGEGAQAEFRVAAERFFAPYDQRNRLRVRADQFQGQEREGRPLVLKAGRFYPRGVLNGVGGMYAVSGPPCRLLGMDAGLLLFDCNHPLAGRDLQLKMEIVVLHPPRVERGGRCEDWLERVCADGPGMQAGYGGGGLLDADDLRRADERPDGAFYCQPRLVQHLDSTARQAISDQYRQLIPAGSRVLDLMASWDSHLPDHLILADLTVLGLNGEELHQNRRAASRFVQDLNLQPLLPFAEASLDAVICTASVEYLTNPLDVMAEIRRVLRPGGLLAFAFTNRWFAPKAIRIWADLHEFERLGLVMELVFATGGFTGITTWSRRGLPRPADDPHQELWLSDPVYMVWGRRV